MQRHALCFAALPQAPCICPRQRSPSSPKAGALPTALHPDFLFCFFLKIFRASLLCPPAIRLTQADHGTCVILIYPAGFVKRVIGRATVAAPSALMHTQRKTPPLWFTPGRWNSMGAKNSHGTAGSKSTMGLPAVSGRLASCSAAHTAAPELIPVSTASDLARRLPVAKASS